MRAFFFTLVAVGFVIGAATGVTMWVSIAFLVIGAAVLGVKLTEKRSPEIDIRVHTSGPATVDVSIGRDQRDYIPGCMCRSCRPMTAFGGYKPYPGWGLPQDHVPQYEPPADITGIPMSSVEAILPFQRVERAWEQRMPGPTASAEELIAWAEGRAEIDEAKQRQIDD